MAKEVEAYLKYIADRREPQKFTLSVQEIRWADWWTGSENVVMIKLGGSSASETVTSPSEKQKRSPGQVSLPFTARESDTVSVEVELANVKGWTFGVLDRPRGTAKYRGAIKDLHEKDLQLENTPKALKVSVTLTVESSLREPALPDWSE